MIFIIMVFNLIASKVIAFVEDTDNTIDDKFIGFLTKVKDILKAIEKFLNREDVNTVIDMVETFMTFWSIMNAFACPIKAAVMIIIVVLEEIAEHYEMTKFSFILNAIDFCL